MRGEYRRSLGSGWWRTRPAYLRFMLRELTAFFVGGYAIFLLSLLHQAGREMLGFVTFAETLHSPVRVALHLAALGMALVHTVTWFHSAPKVVVLRRGERRVSPGVIIGAQYALWVLVSLAIGDVVIGTGERGAP